MQKTLCGCNIYRYGEYNLHSNCKKSLHAQAVRCLCTMVVHKGGHFHADYTHSFQLVYSCALKYRSSVQGLLLKQGLDWDWTGDGLEMDWSISQSSSFLTHLFS